MSAILRSFLEVTLPNDGDPRVEFWRMKVPWICPGAVPLSGVTVIVAASPNQEGCGLILVSGRLATSIPGLKHDDVVTYGDLPPKGLERLRTVVAGLFGGVRKVDPDRYRSLYVQTFVRRQMDDQVGNLFGRSGELSTSMGILSEALGKPLPASIVFTGSVDDSGTIGQVGEAKAKVRAVFEDACAVDKLVVPQADVEDFRSALVECYGEWKEILAIRDANGKDLVPNPVWKRDLRIIPVGTLGEAIDIAYPEMRLERRLRRIWLGVVVLGATLLVATLWLNWQRCNPVDQHIMRCRLNAVGAGVDVLVVPVVH